MADGKPKDQETTEEETKQKKKLNLKTILLIGGCAVAQALIVLVALWVFKSATDTAPPQAEGAEQASGIEVEEVPVIPSEPEAKIKAVNAKSGRLVYWSLKIHLQVPKPQKDYVVKRLKQNENFIKQEITTIVAACDPVILEQEADHATLKRQIRFALNKIPGKGTVNEVLISECIPATLE